MEKIDKGFKNEYVAVTFHDHSRAYVLVKDLTDTYNESTAYTQNIRGISKAWEFITQLCNTDDIKDDLRFNDIVKVLDDKFKLKTHFYCAMD